MYNTYFSITKIFGGGHGKLRSAIDLIMVISQFKSRPMAMDSLQDEIKTISALGIKC
jgi:hypothetical protein